MDEDVVATTVRIRVFICYRRVDGKRLATKVLEHLRGFGVDAFAHLPPAESHLSYADIQRELALSNLIVFIDTPKAGDSVWISGEIQDALDLGIPIIWIRVGPIGNRTPHLLDLSGTPDLEQTEARLDPDDLAALTTLIGHRAKDLAFRADVARQDIEQLHSTLSNISSTCFEFKKLCATVLSAGLAFIGVFVKNSGLSVRSGPTGTAPHTFQSLGNEALVIALVIVHAFWLLDSQSFALTLKIRQAMKQRRQALARYSGDLTYRELGVGLPFGARTVAILHDKPKAPGSVLTAGIKGLHTFIRNAMLDDSMFFYWLLVTIALGTGVVMFGWFRP